MTTEPKPKTPAEIEAELASYAAGRVTGAPRKPTPAEVAAEIAAASDDKHPGRVA